MLRYIEIASINKPITTLSGKGSALWGTWMLPKFYNRMTYIARTEQNHVMSTRCTNLFYCCTQNVKRRNEKAKGVGAIRQSRISTYFDHTQPIIISLGFCARKKNIAWMLSHKGSAHTYRMWKWSQGSCANVHRIQASIPLRFHESFFNWRAIFLRIA